MQRADAFVLKPGEGRGLAPLDVFGGLIWIKLSSADSAGGISILETATPPGLGPPLHRHGREDEWFYVLEGQYIFEVDGKQTIVQPGDTAFAPRGTAHTFQNISPVTGRTVVVAQPAGIDVFFTELAAATQNMNMREPDMAVILPIFARHELEFLGPPMAARVRSGAAADA